MVTGLSGAGKATILRALEDLGFETVDSPPLAVLGTLLEPARPEASSGEAHGDEAAAVPARPFAAGIDVRSRGFSVDTVLDLLARLRQRADVAPQLVFATADEAVLLRRYTETRRRHPMASPRAESSTGLTGPVVEGIARETALLARLRDAADWLVDTSDLPLPELRRLVERRFGVGRGTALAIGVQSFAFPRGLPREADLVFDLRFLRNPHYDPALRPLTGRDPAIAAHIEADPAFAPFWERLVSLIDMLVPRYVAEGKKYLTVAMGCTGGKHRSVLAAERLAAHLLRSGWPVDVTHRELPAPPRPAPDWPDDATPAPPAPGRRPEFPAAALAPRPRAGDP
nr:RNase adapter RapZ [Roseomonas acroporae]